jgi:hypothetical protein
MNGNLAFNLYRTQLLLIRQCRFNFQTLLIGGGAVAGFLVFVLSIRVFFQSGILTDGSFFGLIMPFFFLGGYIFTSNIFSELRSPGKGYLFLTLPASALEKLFVSWLITSVGYIILAMVVMFVINLFLMAIAAFFTVGSVPLFNLFAPGILKMFAIYAVTQSVFMLGAIYFTRANFLKTLLSLFLISFVLTIYNVLVARFVIFHNFNAFNIQSMDFSQTHEDFFHHTFVPFMKILFWGCMAPFFLVVSYFRLKERQV